MKRHLSGNLIRDFGMWLKDSEKSDNTIDKYIRDVNKFYDYIGDCEITKENVIGYKNNLIKENYSLRSINSMLASINSLFSYLGWTGLKVKSIKVQTQIFCTDDKELSKSEYMCIVNTAEKMGKQD